MSLYVDPNQDRQIRAIARECGQQAQKLARLPFEVSEKGPNDYVTSIDQCLDRQLSARFGELFPEDGTITEENSLSRAAFHANYRRLWCIDPLDGTEEFIQKKLYYAVMVGLLCDREPVAGWIYAPAFDLMYWGGKDWGLFQAEGEGKSQPLAIAKPPALTPQNCKIILGDRDRKNFGSAIAQLIPDCEFYSLGSFGLKVLEIILGRASLYIYLNGRVKLWDTVGPLALAKAAGLVCCDLDGEPLKWTTDALDPSTLAHQQAIVVGWPENIEALSDRIRQAVRTVSPSIKK
ncbi:MAG TPA: inositol monophosphatase family protein [Kamptonema sp.]|nr:inositol monophosphatase family protein [Kamptonema sp.]